MANITSKMDLEDIRSHLEIIQQDVEVQINTIVQQVLDNVRENRDEIGTDYLYLTAHCIGKDAYAKLQSWSQQTFKTSPDKELAEMLVKGYNNKFTGPRSIETNIRSILSAKD